MQRPAFQPQQKHLVGGWASAVTGSPKLQSGIPGSPGLLGGLMRLLTPLFKNNQLFKS